MNEFDRGFESPWRFPIACENCKKVATTYSLVTLHGWKEVRMCPTCVQKFNLHLDNKGIPAYNKHKYLYEWKSLHQKLS